jgi:diguanylate cyclase (GGDEF)-like protein
MSAAPKTTDSHTMSTESDFFSTRIGLRVFASFVLAAIIPLAITVGLASNQVISTLEQQAQSRLDEASSNIGQQLLDRLLIVNDLLRSVSSETRAGNLVAIESAQLIVDGQSRTLFGESFSAPEMPDDDAERSTLVVRVAPESSDIFVSRPVEAGIVIAKLDTTFLWEAGTLIPFAMNLCVIDINTRAFLFCTEPLEPESSEVVLREVDQRSTGQVRWSGENGEIMASHWQLFLPSRFESSSWSIVVTQPVDVALAPVNAFNRVFPWVILASLMLTVLLSAVQIRRIMQPLNYLVAGTRRIAKRDFRTRLRLGGHNEFTELAYAMNDMAESLGDQFDTITALAEIDRLILASQSLSEVLEKILDRAVAVSPHDCASILLIDPDNKKRAQLYSRMPGTQPETIHSRVILDQSALHWLASVSAGNIADADWVRARIAELPALKNGLSAAIIPIFRSDKLRGALITQTTGTSDSAGQKHARLAELASRLAVALSAADHESELFRRAHFDSLTGLPNRQLCFDRLYQAVAQARREGHQLAVLFIDLDRFKNVNDSLGHGFGDELLKETALRLMASVRETDTVARLGGDEYVVILPHVNGLFEVQTIVDKIYSILSRPFNLNGQEITVSASIGVTMFPNDATDADTLLQKADTAMYAAKDDGRDRVRFFEEEMDRSLKERLQMQQALHEAYKQSDFDLAYQAQLDLQSGELIGLEALLRWSHPNFGAITPSTFVPLLEEMGMIGPVGRWVLSRALSDFANWRNQGAQMPRIAVNVSALQLAEEGFESFLVDELDRFNLQGENLEIELTEYSVIEDFEPTNERLRRLSKHGIRIAIDDFGTGYSSLGYLQDLRFDTLKIDRAFVKGLPAGKSVAIIEAVLAVAKALGKEVVAEGIDAESQRIKLVELGCTIGQGYLLSIPIPADEVLGWIEHLDQTSVIKKLVAMQA